jgi:hypothetical protein
MSTWILLRTTVTTVHYCTFLYIRLTITITITINITYVYYSIDISKTELQENWRI